MTSLFTTEQKIVAYARVVVERGIDRYPEGLTYSIPDALADLAPGDRVIVPLGRGDRRTAGYVIDRISPKELCEAGEGSPEAEQIKPILRRDATAHRLPRDLIELARWIAGYYCTPIGMVFAAMLPGPVKRGIGRVTRTFVDVAEEGKRPKNGGTDILSVRNSERARGVTDALTIHRRNLPHWQMGGSTYFVTFRVAARPLDESERAIAVNACLHWHGRRLHLHIATVMPDHVHLLVTPLRIDDKTWYALPELMKSIKWFSSQRILAKRAESGPLWLDEYYDRIIRDEDEFYEKWNYIQTNAVRSGLVERVEDYDFTVAPPALEQWDQKEQETHGQNARATDRRPRLSQQQQRILEILHGLPPDERPIEIRRLAALAEVKTLGPIRALVRKGLLNETTRTSIEAEWVQAAVDRFVPDALTAEQRQVLDAIGPQLDAGFSTHLIFGVTASGKTEIYIRLIEQVIAAGQVALVLVPEIALTPQTSGRIIGRFPDHRVAILHSGLTAAQRNQQWTMAAEGEADVVLGARSAVFAPIPLGKLGLVIVDEEHDSSYKQDQAPRYHGRDVAIRRAQLAQCPVILGSATPSLESWWNAVGEGRDGRREAKTQALADANERAGAAGRPQYQLHHLRERVPGTTLPKVHIVDFRAQMRMRKDRSRVHLIGPLLEREIERTLADGHQILILLNRRGFANYIACPDHNCGWVMVCDHCDATMVFHRDRTLPAGGYVRCHHCLSEQKVLSECPDCGKKIVKFGLGTQRVEDELADMFGLIEGETMMRIDSDTMQSAKHFHDALGRFARGELKLLVGTQMIAKGLDFPGVRLVGVINADTAINLPDFRAAERTFQLVNQVAGRCGRGKTAGTVVVQSFQPGAPPIQRAAQHDYEGFAHEELRVRDEFQLPPITRMARIVIRHEDYTKAAEIASDLVANLSALIGGDRSIRLRGPAPCPISRIAGRHRQQIEIIAPTAAALQKLLAAARSRGYVKSDALMAVDVDPIALL